MEKTVKSYSLLVLSTDGAGLPAAVKAKDPGVKDVIILEKAKKPGALTWYSGAEAFMETQHTDEGHLASSSDAKFTMHSPCTGSLSAIPGLQA